MRRGVIVVDIETDWKDDWSEQGKRNRNFVCGVAFSFDDNKYRRFKNPKEFVKFLNKAKAIVSYNGEGFDFLVLEKYGFEIEGYKNRWKPKIITSFDIMHTISEKRPDKHQNKKYPRLEEMINQHFNSHKMDYNPNDLKQVINHCVEDVRYTKMLYEEKTWEVPVIERAYTNRRWNNYYDDDVSGMVWDGEEWTYISDFGMPIGRPNAFDFITGKVPDFIECPLCKKGMISLYHVYKCDTDEEICQNCGGLIKFALGTSTITSAVTKKELAENICPNCSERLEKSGYEHYGYGAGHGFLSHGRSMCPACGKGCYEWEDDDTPGFREHWKGNCCYCGTNVEDWLIKKWNERANKEKNIILNK